MVKGDIVLITFPFTDLSGSKLRPTVVLAETELDITVCFITTQLQWQEFTDVQLLPTSSNGIRKQSLIRTSKIATLDYSLDLVMQLLKLVYSLIALHIPWVSKQHILEIYFLSCDQKSALLLLSDIHV